MAVNLGVPRDGIAEAKVRKMRDAAKRGLLWVAAIAAITVVILVASGEKDEPAPVPPPITTQEGGVAPGDRGAGADERPQGSKPEGGGGGAGAGGRDSGGGRPAADLARERLGREARRTYRAYVEAINARDGEALCDLLAPGFLAELKPAERREDCAATVRASIGYEDPRRFPVWEQTVLTGFEQIAAEPDRRRARVTASVITRFADRTEPSVESDIAYLGPVGGELRLLKASGVLWRAVGKPDYPPTVISPP